MHIHFFLGLAFLEENLTIVDEVKKRYGDKAKFSALVAARSHVMDMLDKKKGTPQEFYRYDWLSALEQKWLDTPLDREKLAKYEEMLGTDTLRRIITADRDIGVGLVTCGIVESTKLKDLTKNNDEARWSYVVGLLDYCFDFYENEKPDMVFMYCIAGAVALAMAEVADYMGVQFSQPVFGRIDDYQLLDNDKYCMVPHIKKQYEAALQDPSLIKDTLPLAKQHLKKFTYQPERPADTKAWLIKIMKEYSPIGMVKILLVDLARWFCIMFGLKGTKGVLRQRKGFSILWGNLRKFFLIHYMLHFEKRKTVENTVGETPFLYFPLHVDPEMSTMVLADKLTDQVSVIERISKSMPAGTKLLVKEHIPCIGMRPRGFYNRIKSLPDVHLVSPFNDNFELIKKSDLVVTMTGSAAWEAIRLKKPALILGKLHFINIGEGFVATESLDKLDQSIKKALTEKPASQKAVETYMATIIKEGFIMSTAGIWFDDAHDQTALKKAAEIIVNDMESMVKGERVKNNYLEL